MERLPIPLLRRRQLGRRRHARVRRAAAQPDPAQGQPVLLRAGSLALRLRPLRPRSRRVPGQRGDARDLGDRRPRRYLRRDQGLSWQRKVTFERSNVQTLKRYMKNTRLPPELQAAWEEIENYARDYGLDFYPII